MTKKDDTQMQKIAMDMSACTCANLRKAARVVTKIYDAALQSTGLKATQFTVLATLVKRGGTPLTRLAEALVMDRTTLTRNLKPLVRRGLICIEQEVDQRVRRVSLTRDGKHLFESARPGWEQAQSRIVESLGYGRWAGFLEDLAVTVAVVRDR
jgi:DNA-binding MarR family transcriptional regulator